MKKIMKKVLSLMLAFVMVMSLQMVTSAAEGDTMEEAIGLQMTEGTVDVEAGATKWFGYRIMIMPAAAYKITVTGDYGFDVLTADNQPYGQPAVMGQAEVTVAPNPMGVIYFAVRENWGENQTFTYKIEEVALEGSYGSPKELVIGSNTATTDGTWNGYYFEYTATEAGTLTVTMPETGWTYSLGDGSQHYYDGDYNEETGAFDLFVPSESVELEEGASVILWVNTYDGNSNPAGTLDITASWQAGEVSGGKKTEIDYVNEETPEKFTLELGKNDEIIEIDVADGEEETIFYNEADGFYHLNTVDGPIIYVNLSAGYQPASIVDMATNEQAYYKYEDADGDTITVVLNDAIEAYAKCADAKTSLYPLTSDLILFFEQLGEYKTWYSNPYAEMGLITSIFGEAELDNYPWMFACAYVEEGEEEKEEIKVLEGADSKWTQESKDGVKIKFDIPFAEFKELQMDGKAVDAKYYTKAEGSTIITLSAEYLNTLTVGKHTITAVTTTGDSVDTSLTVTAKAIDKYSDASAMVISLIVLAGAAFVTAGVVAKKRFA